MGGMAIAKSQTLDVLGRSIRYDLRRDDHVFNVSKEADKCLGFLKKCKKYFTPFDLRSIYVTYIRAKMEYNSHLWAGASKTTLDFVVRIQSRPLKLIGDDRPASTLTLLRPCPIAHYREQSFVTHTVRLWNDLPTNIFHEGCNISFFKTRVKKHFLLSPASI